jgi:hypothetical protein
LAALKREREKRAKKVATSSATDPAENPSTQTAQANCPTQQVPPRYQALDPEHASPHARKENQQVPQHLRRITQLPQLPMGDSQMQNLQKHHKQTTYEILVYQTLRVGNARKLSKNHWI